MKKTNLFPFKALHAVLSVLLFFVFWVLFRYGSFALTGPDRFRYNYYVAAMFAVLFAFLGKTYNIYLLGYTRVHTLAMSQMVSQALAAAVCYMLTSMAWAKWLNPSMLILLMFIYAAINVGWSYLGNRLYQKYNPRKRALLVYRNEGDKRRILAMGGKPSRCVFSIEKCVRCAGGDYIRLMGLIRNYEAVFVAGVDSTTRNSIAKYCVEAGVPGYFMPHVGDIILRGANHIQPFTLPLLNVNRVNPGTDYLIAKRLIDIVASLAGIVVFSPVMLVTAAAIKLQDGGPVLYRQTRLTLNGRKFKMLKFRSMREDAESDGVARLSTGDKDDRITTVGRYLRMCRLDELPQLFNILKGDMTIVGPRPERPEIAELIYDKLPEFKLRLQVKAGLTGYAQVYGKYNTEPYEKLEFDLMYLNNMSLLTDLRLMLATFGVLLKRESTEGAKDSKPRVEKRE